jgi:outer membrane protein
MNRFLHWLLLPGLFIIVSGAVQAQTELGLKNCIETALQNNLSIRQAANSATLAQYQFKQSKLEFIPSLGAGISFNRSQGKYLDNFSFGVSDNPVTINSGVNVYSSYVLFNAFSRWHTLRSSRYGLEATQLAQQALENDICTQVTLSFFQLVFDQENLKITEGKIALLQKQAERTELMLAAGTKTQGDVYNVKSQLATEKVSLVNRQNQYNKDLLTLVQLMNEDPDQKFIVVAPDTNAFQLSAELPPVETIYELAFKTMPDLREKELREQAAAENLKGAKAAFLPSVSVNASANSNYTSNRLEIVRYDTIFGNPIPVYGTDPTPYFEQLTGFFYFNTGLSINIPIFQNYRSRLSYERSRMNLDNAKLDVENTRNNLIKEIQQAYLDAQAAKARYEASAEQLLYLEETLKYMENKYQSGLVDFYAFSEVLNNRTQAQVERLTARYDYILKVKILDLYQGKELTF